VHADAAAGACAWRGPRAALFAHLASDCPAAPVACAFSGALLA
jgi:hypothetical protein